jgi:uncharacterized membrane protein
VAIAHTPKDAPGTSTGGDLGTTAEGWFDVAPQKCSHVSDINAGANWLYYYVTSDLGKVQGTSMLCVTNKPFTIGQQFKRSGETCGRDQHMIGFKREDTAKTNHTVTIN